MNAKKAKRLLERAEDNALLARSVHARLVLQEDVLAPVVWIIAKNAERNAEQLGRELDDQEE
jgi:hypothetical protein